jgi:hypothetical protein
MGGTWVITTSQMHSRAVMVWSGGMISSPKGTRKTI